MKPDQKTDSTAPAKFNGIQMGPHTILDEGIERCLDLIQETAAINALFVYSHTYHDDLKKPPQVLAADHGVPPRDMRSRKLPSVWVKHHEEAFHGTTLRRTSRWTGASSMPIAIYWPNWPVRAGSAA